MNLLFSNPEVIRNARIQLRPGRMIVAAVVCAVASLTTWASIMHTDIDVAIDELQKAGAVFALVLNFQVAILLIGGGIYCLQSVHREKELNTFDYQRTTRLSSLELTFGKLFGSPIAAYFAALCLMPVALVAAAKAHIAALVVLECYVLLFVGSVTYHALALLISVLLGRGGTALAILLFLVIIAITYSHGIYYHWSIENLSPFFVNDRLRSYVLETRWGAFEHSVRAFAMRDEFFDATVPHLVVFVVIHATLTLWLLLAVKRNLKRDPSVYETYSPIQAFAFVLYLGLLMVGFFSWKDIFQQGTVWIGDLALRRTPTPPHSVEQMLLQAGVVLFAVLALVLLRSRERLRRRMREFGSRAAGWVSALWPAPYLVLATGLVGAAVVLLIGRYRYSGSVWDLGLAIYIVTFLAIWLTRDALYLQWMTARRAKRPLLSGVLYLTVFYLATGVLFGSLNFYSTPRRAASTAMIFPTPLFAVGPASWVQQKQLWITALLIQGVTALLFALLHLLRLRRFLLSTSEPAEA